MLPSSSVRHEYRKEIGGLHNSNSRFTAHRGPKVEFRPGVKGRIAGVTLVILDSGLAIESGMYHLESQVTMLCDGRLSVWTDPPHKRLAASLSYRALTDVARVACACRSRLLRAVVVSSNGRTIRPYHLVGVSQVLRQVQRRRPGKRKSRLLLNLRPNRESKCRM
jgi:hypothetical protein